MKELYTCIRCGYTSLKKGNIRHHFSRKKPCPGLVNDIILTDEIKEKILENRMIVVPKKSKQEIVLLEEVRHYIYLIRPKENVKHSQNVYKIGKTKLKELTANFARMTGYGKGTELVKISMCTDCDKLERTILEVFNNKFEKYEFGSEYFIGSVREMSKIIDKLVDEQLDTIEIINNDNIKNNQIENNKN